MIQRLQQFDNGVGKGTVCEVGTERRDSRVPVRTIDLGSVVGEVYEQSGGTWVDLTIRGGGKLSCFLHELKSIALISLLLERGPIGKRL